MSINGDADGVLIEISVKGINRHLTTDATGFLLLISKHFSSHKSCIPYSRII